MQGRMVPPIDGNIQMFPVGVWPEEFLFQRRGSRCDGVDFRIKIGTCPPPPVRASEDMIESPSVEYITSKEKPMLVSTRISHEPAAGSWK